MAQVAAEENLLFALAEGHRAEFLAHAPLANHLARQLGGLLEIVAGASGHVPEDQLFRGASAEHHRKTRHQVFARIGIAFVHRKLLGNAERYPSWNDSDFVYGIRARQ